MSSTFVQRGRTVLAEYVRHQYTEGTLNLYRHLRTLPRAEARLTSLGLGMVTLAVIATPLLALLAPRLTALSFEDVMGTIQTISPAAFTMAAAIFALAWGYLLAGAAVGPGLLWVVTATLYVYLFVTMGVAAGRTPLHLMVSLLPVAVGAVTRPRRRWATATVICILASVSIRIGPFPPAIRMRWYLYWLPAVALLAVFDYVLSRRPWRSAPVRMAAAAALTAAYLLLIGRRLPAGELAGWFNVSLNSAISILETLWFLLGASFVAGAIELGRFAKRIVEIVAPDPLPRWALAAAGALLVLWVWRFPAEEGILPVRTYAAALLGGMVLLLLVRWRRRGLTREWIAGWFVATVAALAVLNAYLTLDISEVLTREAGVLSLLAFAYAVLWEVTGRIPKVPLETRGFARPSPLLLYLGVILLVSAATLFGLTANLRFFQEVVILYEYKGAVSLLVPIALLALMRSSPAFPPEVRRRTTQAFLLGAVTAVPLFLLSTWATRAQAGSAARVLVYAGLVLAVALLAALLVRRWAETRTPLPAAAIGVATGLGVAVSLWQRVLVIVLHPLLTMAAALGGPRALKQGADTIFAWANTAPWRPMDVAVFYGLSPLLAAGVALAVARASTRRTAPARAAGR